MKNKLKKFTALNPEIELIESDDSLIIEKPWGDDTLSIRVSPKATELVKSLNSLRLPTRFSAIWHKKTKDLEFIYAPIREDADERSRNFSFNFKNKAFNCEYKDASKDLILLANAMRPKGPASDTNHRNLSNLRSFLRVQSSRNEDKPPLPFKLTSFWIRKVDFEEEDLPEFARHINFYMHYFDRGSPIILIHEEPITEKVEKIVRYPEESFPSQISASELDAHLLNLWESSVLSPDTSRRFLYCYQIVEYAAFYYLKDDIRRSIKRVLLSPQLLSNIDHASKELLDLVVEERTDDEVKFNTVIKQCVKPLSVWKEIENKVDFFSIPTSFDGGFTIPELIKKEWKFDDYNAGWFPKLPDTLKKIRNAIAHSREKRQANCLTATSRNQHLLRPWSYIMSAVAMDVILYKDL